MESSCVRGPLLAIRTPPRRSDPGSRPGPYPAAPDARRLGRGHAVFNRFVEGDFRKKAAENTQKNDVVSVRSGGVAH